MAINEQEQPTPTSNSTSKQLWGGRFRSRTDPIMTKFNESLSVDQRMWEADIIGSIAYASGLGESDVITKEEMTSIHQGLQQIKQEWMNNQFLIKEGDEDIHTANERRLTELIGSIGGKLHTGRSRNDQVTTDLRIYMKNIINQKVMPLYKEFIRVVINKAEDYIEYLMPGFTHLQPAQPIRFSQWMMSYVASFLRDIDRLNECYHRMNQLPLGSGALAGNAFSMNRTFLSQELKFIQPTMNSLDSVCDRDYVVDFMYFTSMTMIHLSQLSEDLIIYNTMKLIEMDDAYSTGSSLMPQKKNPDALELLRGKTGSINGRLFGFMMTLKGLPRSYNKDLQEDKENLFYCVDTIIDCLQIATGVIATLRPQQENMKNILVPEMLATDLAEYLVRKGVPFRETHHIAGRAVRLAEDKNIPLSKLTLNDLQSLHPLFEKDAMKLWEYEESVERKNAIGGTAKKCVLEQIQLTKKWLENHVQQNKTEI